MATALLSRRATNILMAPYGSSSSTSRAYSSDTLVIAAAAAGVGVLVGTVLGRFLASRSKLTLATRPIYHPGQTPSPPSPQFGQNTISFDPSQLTSTYNLMISTITPRPIALVSSRHPKTGIDNVAPFSYFGCVGHDPPMVAIGFCRGRNATMKDSITNILASKQFSIQIISEWYLDAANHSCGAFPPNVDEYEKSGMSKEECKAIKSSRVKEAGVTFECALVQVHTMQNAHGMPTTEIVLAQVVQVHVDETLLVKGYDPLKPEVDTTKLKPVGRLGGNCYTSLGEIVDIPRPQV